MKNFTLLLCLLVLPLTLFAERVVIRNAERDVSATVLPSNPDQILIRIELNAFERAPITINGQTYYEISCDKEGVLLNAGEPSLPRVCRSVVIPDDAGASLRVVEADYVDYPETPVAPSKGNLSRAIDPSTVPYSFGAVYQSDAWYPETRAELGEPYILRDLRGAVATVNIFASNPVTRTLRVYTSVLVEITTGGISGTNVLERREPFSKVDPTFDLVYRRHFANYGQQTERYTPVMEDGEMLVITADAYQTAMQPFVQWKLQKGLRTTLVNVSTIGNNSTAIKNFIQNFYNTTLGNLAYVLLVGDAANVATPTASGGSADPTYAKVVGTDNYPDIFIGRFSAESVAHVQTQVERSVEYERDGQAEAAWYHLATGVASAEGDGIGHNGGEIDYEHMGLIRTDLLGYRYTSVDQIYDPGATAAQVSTALNAGRGFVNYTGHGSSTSWGTTGFSNTNVTALTNDNKLPFIFSVACVNGQFDGYTCFAESWLRSTHNSQPVGAVATYMSSINQDWVPPMDAQDEATDLLRAEAKTTFGGLCFNAACKMIDLNGTSGANMYNTWHIFGDPSLLLYTNTPAAMTVNHDGVLSFGQTEYDVTVTGVSGALCALYLDGTLYGAANTNASGQAAIPVTGEPPVGQNLKLTVTAFNKMAFIADVSVITAGPDLWAPNVTVTPLPDTQDATGPYVVNATVRDYSGVESATLYLGYDGNHFSGRPMTRGAGDAWSVSLFGEPAGTVLYYYLTATDSSENHNIAFTDTMSFAVLGVIYSNDMESGAPDWTHTANQTGWFDQWHVSTEQYHGGTHAWKFGDPGTGTYVGHCDGVLTTPEIFLRSQSTLSFWQWMQSEASTYYPDSAYDGGLVELSVDGGAWSQMTGLTPGYAKVSRCTAGASNPYTGPFVCRTPLFGGDLGWTQVTANLDAYAGHSVRLRFRFGSDNSGNREGWYIDDLTVLGLPPLAAPEAVADLQTIVLSADSVQLIWTATPRALYYKVLSAAELNGTYDTQEAVVTDTTATVLTASGVKRFYTVVASTTP